MARKAQVAGLYSPLGKNNRSRGRRGFRMQLLTASSAPFGLAWPAALLLLLPARCSHRRHRLRTRSRSPPRGCRSDSQPKPPSRGPPRPGGRACGRRPWPRGGKSSSPGSPEPHGTRRRFWTDRDRSYQAPVPALGLGACLKSAHWNWYGGRLSLKYWHIDKLGGGSIDELLMS